MRLFLESFKSLVLASLLRLFVTVSLYIRKSVTYSRSQM
jgi:hypothetical protein